MPPPASLTLPTVMKSCLSRRQVANLMSAPLAGNSTMSLLASERNHRDRGGGLHTTDDLDVEPGLLGGRRAGEQHRREQQDKGVQRNRFAHEAHHCGMKVKVRLRWNTLSKPLYGKVLVRRMAFSTERRPASSYGQLESTVA